MIGNLLKNSYITSPDGIENCKKRLYYSGFKNEDSNLRIGHVIPHENTLVRYLMSEGFISNEKITGGMCRSEPLSEKNRERVRKTGWESSDCDSYSQSSGESDNR